MSITARRNTIIADIVSHLEPVTSILALYQCGAAAFGRVDEWSDIDFIVLVEDGAIEPTFRLVDTYLESRFSLRASLGELKTSLSGVWEKTYSFEGESPYHIIEVAIIEKAAGVRFVEREIHGDIIIHFDKVGFTAPVPIDTAEFSDHLAQRLDQIEARLDIYHILPKKELHRGNAIEAFAFYYTYTLQPYLELLRIAHDPFRHSFGARYVYYDLPEGMARSLEPYFLVPDIETLSRNVAEIQNASKRLITELRDLDLIQHLEQNRRTG